MSRTRRFLQQTVMVAAAATGPGMAMPFTVNEGTVPGSAANTVSANQIGFTYEARIVQTLVGPTYDGNDPFSQSGFLTKSSYSNGGSAVPSQLNALFNGYGIYGLFNITGVSEQQGAGIIQTFGSATMNLFVDPNQNTSFGFTGNIATATAGTGDDYAIVTYTLLTGEQHLFGGLANGDFDSILNLSRTNNGTPQDGESFFSGPAGFYLLENFGGNVQTISGASLTSSFVADISGGGTEIFFSPGPDPGQPGGVNGTVSEPETYALILAGLVALGFSRRRNTK